jgi:hypothetical protein
MGRAARANPRANSTTPPTDGSRNPEPVRLMATFASANDVSFAHRNGRTARVKFSDRAYTIDARGVFRRAPFFHLNREG